MDVRFYPSAPATAAALAADPNCLGTGSCLEHYYSNKFDGDNMYMSLSDANQDYLPANQTFHSQVLGDEDYEIPPITPPNLGEPSFLHLMDPHGGYHSLCHAGPANGLIPQYHYQGMDLPAIMVSNMLSQDGHLLSGQLPMQMAGVDRGEGLAYDSSGQHPMDSRNMLPHHRMPVIGHAQLAAQMGMNLGRGGMHAHSSPSPPGSKSATPSPSSSVHEEEADVLAKMSGDKRGGVDMGKKTKGQKKKKKKDPNEPQKPVSAYALFFRDTQAAIKGQNPSATFGDVSKIVASMWDGLGEEQKQAYKKKTESAKKEYLKALAAYRASLVSKSYNEPVEPKAGQSAMPPHLLPTKPPLYSLAQASGTYIGTPPFLGQPELQPYPGPTHHRPHGPKPTLPGSPPPPPALQISPPLHQQLSLHQHHSAMQQPLHPHPLQVQAQLHSPPAQQGYTQLPLEFQSGVSAPSPGPAGPNAPTPGSDWENEFCNSECIINHCSLLPRDKPLYLT
ncbi:TOX high mobility group box family member 2 isoform X3 [Leucoraja erinacea]|uniref:TOX high mobility group box family member 2 isoform X3 n=1 Tax=Leucoraja erinaceus TaxID=7782 RepID=UPI002457BBD5|nr:TOX high mobility group box family member 2 isoform X3 [Leucoraja erinacea]